MAKRKMSARDALDLVPDDLPDGAYFAMAAEMAGVDYEDFFDELAEEDLGPSIWPTEPAPKPPKRFKCDTCGKRFATKKAERQHAFDSYGRGGHLDFKPRKEAP